MVQKNHGRIQTSVETMFHPFLIGSSPSSTPVFLSSFSPLLQPYLRARANFFFPFHFLPFHLLPHSFTLSPLLSFSFSFFFFFPSSFSSLCTASFQTCAQASTFLLAAFIAPACALITPYTRLRSYRGIKFDSSICT